MSHESDAGLEETVIEKLRDQPGTLVIMIIMIIMSRAELQE
jgi:hypothetical protein